MIISLDLTHSYMSCIFLSGSLWFWDSVPIGSLKSSILIKCDFHGGCQWWLRHGAMGPSEGSLFQENADRPTSELTIFNLVICVSHVKQSFTFRASPGRVDCVEQLAKVLGVSIFRYHCQWSEAAKPPFFQRCSSDITAHTWSGNRHVLFPAGVVSLVFGEVNQLCTWFVKIWKPF